MSERTPRCTEMQWLYEHSPDGASRFVLGTAGANPLICFGVNPSTARPEKLDPTVARVSRIAQINGYDSWIMLNIYPQISTDPKGLHRRLEPALKSENERWISAAIADSDSALLAAWGVLVGTRPYLRTALSDILALPAIATRDWMSLGQPTRDGHPRHPSRLAASTRLQPFDVDGYR